jgi:hypothetical protein
MTRDERASLDQLMELVNKLDQCFAGYSPEAIARACLWTLATVGSAFSADEREACLREFPTAIRSCWEIMDEALAAAGPGAPIGTVS